MRPTRRRHNCPVPIGAAARPDEQGPPPERLCAGSPQDAQQRDMFCRRDAAARTGYVTPGQAASNAQTNGTVGGTLGGAALGAIIGSAVRSCRRGRRDRRGRRPSGWHRGRFRQCAGAAGDVQQNYAEPIMPAWAVRVLTAQPMAMARPRLLALILPAPIPRALIRPRRPIMGRIPMALSLPLLLRAGRDLRLRVRWLSRLAWPLALSRARTI